MAAATVQLQCFTGATGAVGVNGEAGFKYSREDSLAGTTPVPIPTVTGTNFSWVKWLGLAVVSTGTTSMSNRRIQLSVAETAGLGIFFQASGGTGYSQATSLTMPVSGGTNGPATPTSYTRATSGTATAYDSTNTTATTATGKNGNFVLTVLGVDSAYAGGAGTAVALPDVRLIYDEA